MSDELEYRSLVRPPRYLQTTLELSLAVVIVALGAHSDERGRWTKRTK
jgi:hypothetical protein